MNIDNLVNAAVDLRIATLRAREQGIINYTEEIKNLDEERFNIYSEKDFREMIATRPYKIVELGRHMLPYKYRYKVKVSGLNFTHITINLLFENDNEKIEEEL